MNSLSLINGEYSNISTYHLLKSNNIFYSVYVGEDLIVCVCVCIHSMYKSILLSHYMSQIMLPKKFDQWLNVC